ncbi:hypothetical protein SAMN04488005_0845 [Yoonia tamlensis]|uniref:Pentapeptide repeat-containing protein n=1 Tax=Yoonia tamlensis TaxID=390270 RepID=A0A1I6G0C5_9RHOB|nr:hypothetical protein [Yoonia tamlensis]SFR35629.1 hypothetical protein SAMN04488005_0845 [Yoonia tamlensis]
MRAVNADLLVDDCTRCAALCCMAFAFDNGGGFGVDKQAGQACPHLAANGGCAIYDQRDARGFSGCAKFTCNGSGQRVTQEVFAGQNWRDDPALTIPMMQAFAMARAVHALLLLLQTAQKLPLNGDQSREIVGFIAALTPAGQMSQGWLRDVTNSDIESRVHRFLRSLAPLVGNR